MPFILEFVGISVTMYTTILAIIIITTTTTTTIIITITLLLYIYMTYRECNNIYIDILSRVSVVL